MTKVATVLKARGISLLYRLSFMIHVDSPRLLQDCSLSVAAGARNRSRIVCEGIRGTSTSSP